MEIASDNGVLGVIMLLVAVGGLVAFLAWRKPKLKDKAKDAADKLKDRL